MALRFNRLSDCPTYGTGPYSCSQGPEGDYTCEVGGLGEYGSDCRRCVVECNQRNANIEKDDSNKHHKHPQNKKNINNSMSLIDKFKQHIVLIIFFLIFFGFLSFYLYKHNLV